MENESKNIFIEEETMKRKEYMERLEQLLLVLPLEEREEALQYYNDYFDDAGMENEDKVILELGSPEEVAAKIRAGYAGESGEYSEQGFEDVRFQHRQDIIIETQKVDGVWEEACSGDSYNEKNQKRTGKQNNTNVWKVVALILIAILVAPVVLPLGVALAAVIFALLVALLAVLASVGISGFAILFAGIVVMIAGIVKVIIAPATGILATGIGCILLAVGVLVTWVIVSLFVKVVPGLLRGIVKILGTPFRKAGAK